MAGSRAAGGAAPAPLTLVSGPEELLADRAVAEVVAAARAADPSVEICDLAPGALQPGGLAELVSPSLFGEAKVVVLRAIQDLGADQAEEVKRYLADPAEQIVLVLTHPGGVKGKALLDAVRKHKPVVVDCPKLTKPAERITFLRAEFRRQRRAISEEAAQAVADAVGSDLRELAAAADQLIADTEGTVDEAVVARYYSGKAEVSGFAVADLAVEGRLGEALEQLRFALDTGVASVLITSALATGVRQIGKVAAAGPNARDLGMPPWRVDKIRRQARGWTPDGLSVALRAVATADAAVKGAAADPAYALEKCVVAIAGARSAQR
ncbi:DNA polymerase III subunit delta [Actinocrinis puniceicyclus]|uniref:DNA-directed DNA polymerase n=1 Tax=Actinocrinis puniceicyclus TaxID=977794 RepID=A0A8J7WLH7_9ACTN|nr:DNA polymerase III subunit delta [Actinocrinis puniceicyclus]MBS2961964.1 DNA polymerase III subunit delta [Actinocrinis puniceicyclus]